MGMSIPREQLEVRGEPSVGPSSSEQDSAQTQRLWFLALTPAVPFAHLHGRAPAAPSGHGPQPSWLISHSQIC